MKYIVLTHNIMADENTTLPLDEGPINVQHYGDRHYIFANPHLCYLKGDQAICMAPMDSTYIQAHVALSL